MSPIGIIQNNIVINCSVGIQGYDGFVVEYCCAYNNGTNFSPESIQGPNSITSNPEFSAAIDDYHLLYTSPCINTGDPESHVDPDGSRNDMGIYGGEFAWDPYYVLIPEDVTTLSGELQYSTYRIMSDITIEAGEVLTVADNAILKFEANKCLTVNGQLDAHASEGSEITFTSYTEGEQWAGILFEGSAESIFKYCDIKDAQFGLYINHSAPGIITQNTIQNCGYGIYALDTWINITDNHILNNEFDGIYFYGIEGLLDGNTINDNGNRGIYLEQSDRVDIISNIIEGNSIPEISPSGGVFL